jgi:hypothetical protein
MLQCFVESGGFKPVGRSIEITKGVFPKVLAWVPLLENLEF